MREIEELLRKRSDPSATCGELCQAVTDKLAEIDNRASALTAQASTLRNVLHRCDGNRDKPATECPVWELEIVGDEQQ